MAHLASQPLSLWRDPFVERTAHGLFSAPWLETPSPDHIAALRQLSDTLVRTTSRPDDLSITLGHLLAVHGHCQHAALARDPRTGRQHYADAMRECETAIARLHHSRGGTPAALAAWALGVHTLIRAQIAMTTEPAVARLLAYEALQQLSGILDPLCAGAETDALSAMLLVREPTELEDRLVGLVDEVRCHVETAERAVAQKESALNGALQIVRQSHEQALIWAAGWGLLNLALLATWPISTALGASVPQAVLPFLLGLPILWVVTWFYPLQNGLTLFEWVRSLRLRSLEALHAVAADLPRPLPDLSRALELLVSKGSRDQERLAAFYLFALPERWDTCWKVRAIAAGAVERLQGDWLAELSDRAPWPLAEVLPTEPSMLPLVTRIWYGTYPRH